MVLFASNVYMPRGIHLPSLRLVINIYSPRFTSSIAISSHQVKVPIRYTFFGPIYLAHLIMCVMNSHNWSWTIFRLNDMLSFMLSFYGWTALLVFKQNTKNNQRVCITIFTRKFGSACYFWYNIKTKLTPFLKGNFTSTWPCHTVNWTFVADQWLQCLS